MIYSRYFKAIIREGGIRSLEPNTLAQIMNIIHLEGKLEGMNMLKEKMKDSAEPYKFDFELLKVKSQLSSITHDLPPKELLRRFYEVGGLNSYLFCFSCHPHENGDLMELFESLY